MKINGGYYIKARKIQESKIHRHPPYVREIWDWLLMNANHSDNKYNGHEIKRGQLFRTYKEIREGLAWYVGYRKEMYNENHTKKAMKALREAGMIDTTKALGGVMITILNYNKYQNPKNYESTNDGTNEGTNAEPRSNQGGPDNNKNEKKDKNEKNVIIYSDEIKNFTNNYQSYVLNAFPKTAPKITDSLIEKCCDTIDKLIRLDNFTFDEVYKAIQWASNDDFWSDQILSLAQLRNKAKNENTKFINLFTAYQKKDAHKLNSAEQRFKSNNEAVKEFINGHS